MTLDPAQWLAIGGVLVSVVFWFARLEGKVQSHGKDMTDLKDTQTAMKAKADADANTTNGLKETLIRMDERLIHLTDLVERLAPRRKPAE